MASVNWVHPTCRSPFLKRIRHIPYLLGDDGEYLDGPNLYLQERCSGRLRLKRGNENQVATFYLSRNSIAAIAYRMANFMTWLETVACHPTEGRIHWTQVAEWHIKDLYRDQMILGYWTQEYWATGKLFSLNFSSTIQPRLVEAMACCTWMYEQGLICWPKPEPSIDECHHAYLDAKNALEQALPTHPHDIPEETEDVRYPRRQDPSNWAPLTPVELSAILRHMPDTARKLAAKTYLASGMRLDELLSNMLVPGTVHLRSEDEQKLARPRFPRKPYVLRYDPKDDSMIGVLPDEEAAFSPDQMLPYRIMGKGKKIRRVYLPSWLCRDLWRYYVTERPRVKTSSQSHMLLNSRGDRMRTWSVSHSTAKARKAAEAELGSKIAITTHVLRHTYACLFLESFISSRAKEDGLDQANLSQHLIERYGSEATVILQELLGHALIKDTNRYLRQLSMGRVGLRYLHLFHSELKNVFGADATF
jgi:integrase